MGQFCDNIKEMDWDTVLFHEPHAAELGALHAIVSRAKFYMGIPPDIVINCRMSSCDDNIEQGLGYTDEAAKSGDRSDMFLARVYETGMNLGTQRKQSYRDAVNWYDKAFQMANIGKEDNKEEYYGTIAPWITGEPGTTPHPPLSSEGVWVPAVSLQLSATKPMSE